ncbi:MAG: uracil-DNA glycosylase [Dialister invisus]
MSTAGRWSGRQDSCWIKLFVGRITRDHVYVTNIVKCRPRGNRTPTIAEGNECGRRWLAEEIRILQPKVIIALGKVALRFFLGHDAGIIRSRGHWIDYKGIPVMPTFHPAYLLRQTGEGLKEAKWQVYYDLKAAKRQGCGSRARLGVEKRYAS